MLKAEEVNLKEKMIKVAQAVFQLYANLLTEKARQPWDVIVKEQMESSSYSDIFGVKWKKSPGKMSKSFQKCQLLHLKSRFSHDTAENLRFYISHRLRSPTRCTLVSFCSVCCS